MAEGPIQGLSIGLGLDTTGIDQGLKQLKPKLAMVNSEMKANMSAFDKGEKSVNKYETQLTGLNKKLELQKSATAAAKAEYEKMVAQHGEGSRQAERAATAYNNEVASVNNLERHVNSLTDELRQFQTEQDAANSGMGRLGSSLDNVGGKVSAIGGKMTSAGKGLSMGLTAPIMAFGAAGIAAFNEVDEAIDTVITKTGATGAAAEVLTENFRTVAKRVPQDLQSVGDAIGEVNTQFGFMGKELEDASELMLQFADINGTDVTAASIASKQAIEAYGLANSDLNSVLDSVTKTAQDTGQSVDDLFDKATKGAPQIKALGLNFAEGTALIGGFEKAGVDSGAALSSLSKAQVNFAKDGKTLEEGLNDTIKSIMNAKSETDALTTASEIFGTKGGPRMVDAIKRGTFNLEDFAGASEKAAGAVKNTFDETVDPIDQAAIAMNNAKLAMSEVGEVIQVALLPFMEKATSVLGNVADKFRGMSPEAKNATLMIGGIAAAAGPVLMVLGGLASSLGAVITFFGSAATAVSIMGTGVAAATPLIGGLASVFTVLTGPIGLGIAAVAGLTIAGVALYNHLKKDAIPEVDRFGDQVSESTKEALGGFFELSDGAQENLIDLRINGTAITEEMAAEMVGQYASMNEQIMGAMKSRHNEELQEMESFFAESQTLTSTREAEIVEERKKANQKAIEDQDFYENRVKAIMESALAEKRELTKSELDQIDAINKEMNENAVKYLSESEMEQKIIMERMVASAGDLNARQAAEVVKKSAEARDAVIADAEAKYDEVVAFAIRERDETGSISEEEAAAIIKSAEITRNTSVFHAEKMHEDVVGEAKLQAQEHVKLVDWSTGEILSKWDVYKNGVVERFRKTNEESLADFKRWGNNFSEWQKSVSESSKLLWDVWGKDLVVGFARSTSDALSKFKNWGGLLKSAGGSIMTILGNEMMGGLGKVVNGLIGGLNWVLDKLSVKKIPLWNVPKFGNNGGASGGGGGSRNAIAAYAHGTPGHPGGLALVGDGKGDNAGSELIHTPDGKLGLSPASNTLLDLPKGTTVLSAKETKRLFSPVPKYANGIGDIASHMWGAGKDLLQAGKAKVFDVFDYLTNPKKLLDIGLAAAGFKMPSAGGFIKDALSGGMNMVKNGALDFIKKQLADFGGSGQGFGSAFRKTSSFGFRFHPITGEPSMHNGDDYGAAPGTPIPAQAGGRVSQAGFHGIRGNFVRVKTGIMERIYQHNLRNLVGTGDTVKAGQYVGTVGSTGSSTGPHLHYEVLRNGRHINPKGLATGGMTTGFMTSTLHEEGYPEIVIPTAPHRRTDAMKLLALAGRKIAGGNDNNVIRPNQLPNAQGNDNSLMQKLLNATLEQNQLLLQIFQKDSSVYMDSDSVVGTIGNQMDTYFGNSTSNNAFLKGMK